VKNLGQSVAGKIIPSVLDNFACDLNNLEHFLFVRIIKPQILPQAPDRRLLPL
jgi:hypothetical protein